MSRATFVFILLFVGVSFAALGGYLLIRALWTDSLWIRKLRRVRGHRRFLYWKMRREQNPFVFWANVGMMAVAFAFGVFLVGLTLIFPTYIR
jgi:hypothetical protein